MKEVLIQLLTAFLASLGFSMLFGVRRRFLLATAVGGMLNWAVYLAAEALLHVSFVSCLLAAASSVLYAELLARWLKTPATIFVIPAILPLVPGSSLYYAMSSAVQGDMVAARDYGMQTLSAALAIAAGISLIMALRELQTRRT